ncbi:hypothetical protein H2200_010410 [Cladophialophora chaetospira]|uniref:Uncharacterized protein n=1 Tax=Cladophialophora chaetospira TaxID=386627 RepID=A0AA38X1F8_9EURO|nr:hypothetical protein H2200_010410 [Cladophialophora chaetospira]
MADLLKDYQINLEPLRGQLNYQQWTQDFQAVAQMKGFWEYFTGGQPSIIQPSDRTHEKKNHKGEVSGCFRCEADMKAWQEEKIKIQQAIGLLRYSVEPAIRCDIPISVAGPQEAWKLIEERYKPYGEHAQELAEAKMNSIHFDQCTDVSTYLNRVNQVWHELHTANATFNESEIASKILQDIPNELHNELGLLYRIGFSLTMHPNLKELTNRLLVAELKLKAQARPAGRK